MQRILITWIAMLLLLVPIPRTFSQAEKKSITLEDIYKNRKFASRGVYGLQSMKDGIHYCQQKNDSINAYEYATGNLFRTIVTSANLVPAGDT